VPRGGSRNGTQGKAYSNRTDLGGQNVVQPQTPTPNKLAVQAATGQAYGAASAQKASQSAVPMAGSPIQSQGAMQPQSAPQAPTPVTSMFAPTAYPNQPVTAGVANSPGAGPEVLGLDTNPIAMQYQTGKTVIQQLAADPNSGPALQFLAQRINGAY
jgi:hypothetical protein